MLRIVPSLVALIAATSLTPVLAADMDNWGEDLGGADFRTSYPTEPGDWAGLGDKDDPLQFEFGVRYYYSMGAQKFDSNSPLSTDPHGEMSQSDVTQFVEGHLRIDDHSTKTWATAVAGYGFSTSGEATDDSGTTVVNGGHLGYAGADIGYAALGDGHDFGASPFVGYMYWNDSPNGFADSFVTQDPATPVSFDPSSGQTYLPGDSEVNDIALHMLRLGVSADAKLGSMMDFSVQVAGVPYANINGTLGAGMGDPTGHLVVYDNPTSVGPQGYTGAFNIDSIQSSATTISGWGYGGMAQAMVGFHPSENVVFRIGGRAWYVQGVYDASFDYATISDPTDSTPPVAGVGGEPDELNAPNFDTPPIYASQTYITRDNPFSLLRYGLLAELTYSF